MEGKFRGSGLFDDHVVFRPRCGKGGACDVFGESGKGGFRFDYDKKTYFVEHTYSDRCGNDSLSAPLETNVAYRFRVAKAKWIDDEWRATQLKVTSRVNSPGAKNSVTSGFTVRTVTCDPYHETNSGTMVLAGRY